MVDGIWSLQYLAAGPICGSAGPLTGYRAGAGADQAGGAGAAAPPASHAVLFRYANEAALTRFEAQPRVQLMLSGTGAPAGTGEDASTAVGCPFCGALSAACILPAHRHAPPCGIGFSKTCANCGLGSTNPASTSATAAGSQPSATPRPLPLPQIHFARGCS